MARDRTARSRIRQYLATAGPIVDPSGYATSMLKDAVAYTGSSVAFIQLIAAMDRDGEIKREIVGKRTFRIEGIGAPVLPSPETVTSPGRVSVTTAPGQPTLEIDYRLLAKALVAELLSATAAAHEETAPASSVSTADALEAERDEYARRLEIARNQINELLGKPLGSTVSGDEVGAARATD